MAKRAVNSTTPRGARNLPNNPGTKGINRDYQLIAEEQFTPVGNGGKSLLRSVSHRFPSPPSMGSKLYFLVKERQGAYASLLGRIISGWSLSAASTAIGISRHLVKDWLATGLQDQQLERDTYYSRFASDVHAALALAVGTAESRLAISNPLEYLRSGPGRAFYRNEQYWQPIPPGYQNEDDVNPLNVIGGEANNSDEDESRSRLSEALNVLRNSGILATPEFTQQLADQHQLPLVNDGTPAVVDALPASEQPATDPDAPAPDSGEMDRSMRTEHTHVVPVTA